MPEACKTTVGILAVIARVGREAISKRAREGPSGRLARGTKLKTRTEPRRAARREGERCGSRGREGWRCRASGGLCSCESRHSGERGNVASGDCAGVERAGHCDPEGKALASFVRAEPADAADRVAFRSFVWCPAFFSSFE
jgi:hypothetical protein